jgi:hypothetical protein
MLALLGRLFLLVLLLCDWGGDPYFGHNPLSHPLGSQEVYCYSIGCKEDVCKNLVPLRHTQATDFAAVDRIALPNRPSFRPTIPFPDVDRVFDFKAIRC